MLNLHINNNELLGQNGAINEHGLRMMARMPEFDYLTRQEVSRLAELGSQIYQKDETLLRSGEDMQVLIILLAGVCNIKSPLYIEGKQVQVCVEKVHAPAVLGEVSIFSTRPRSASVVTDRKSVAIVVPARALRELFVTSKATLPRMLWSFARLGIARIRSSAFRFDNLRKKHIKNKAAKIPDFYSEIKRIEKIIGPSAERSMVDEGTFDQISSLLEKVDSALSLISYFDQMKDHPMPSREHISGDQIEGFSPLTRRALAQPEDDGGSIKNLLADICGAYMSDETDTMKWNSCVEGMVLSLTELSNLIPYAFGEDNRRMVSPGTEEMIRGFSDRIENELNALKIDAAERFGLATFPQTLPDDNLAAKLDTYLSKKVKSIKARVSLEDFESDVLEEYHRPAEEIRDHMAIALYNRLREHPVIRVILSQSCQDKERCGKDFPDANGSLLDFFCHGCKLIYPEMEEGDESAGLI